MRHHLQSCWCCLPTCRSSLTTPQCIGSKFQPPTACCCLAQINTKKDVDHDVVIGIGFLTSYEHMGMAYLECRSGCKCKRKELQGMIDVKASQTDW